MSNLDLQVQPDRATDPNLYFGDYRGQRYPNQFFDLSQQYMPPTIKELFRWCTFYYYNSPLLGAALKKISRYPITDLIYEDNMESVRDLWKKVLTDTLKIKDRHMELNLDYHVYGNSFASTHLPFTRFLICPECGNRQPIQQWDWSFGGASMTFRGKCDECGYSGALDVKDSPYKDVRGIRIIRWSPENIHLKYNDYTGRYIYMYTVPGKLKNAILRGDKDILEDVPIIVLDAIKKKRMIRLNPDNIKHLKNPTLAEQDQGWGKPAIIHVLKDMYYFYTLRRAQEAIALEHIVPFDIIYPLPNAQQDPYIHTDLASWRLQIESTIRKHRRDPNFKAVIPIPVGFGRLGGDGKALLLSPELNYLTQTIVGGIGIPQEFLFGGLNYTGSSISLRTLENDFVQNRSQLLDFTYWVKNKIRIWMGYPDLTSMRFADFRMADDVQKNQQLIGLNAQRKVSDQTLLTELGYDYDQEVQKMIGEQYIMNYLTDLQSKGAAKSQGEASVIQYNYQQKIQELAAKAQADANATLGLPPTSEAPAMEGPQPSGGLTSEFQQTPVQPGTEGQQMPVPDQLQNKITGWANSLAKMPPQDAQATLMQLKTKMPDIGRAVEQQYQMLLTSQTSGRGQGQTSATSLEPNMNPMPQQRAPRRAEAL